MNISSFLLFLKRNISHDILKQILKHFGINFMHHRFFFSIEWKVKNFVDSSFSVFILVGRLHLIGKIFPKKIFKKKNNFIDSSFSIPILVGRFHFIEKSSPKRFLKGKTILLSHYLQLVRILDDCLHFFNVLCFCDFGWKSRLSQKYSTSAKCHLRNIC